MWIGKALRFFNRRKLASNVATLCLQGMAKEIAEIYKYLWMLISEQDVEIFQENIKAFITHWSEKQPKFVSYFKEYYANRVGKI